MCSISCNIENLSALLNVSCFGESEILKGKCLPHIPFVECSCDDSGHIIY